MVRTLALALCVCLVPFAFGDMVISEWMYSGTNGEYIEFTNTGPDPVDMTGWSFDDDSQVPGTVDLSAFGIVEPGASVVLAEAPAADFIAAWSLSDVVVIGELATNLGRNDEINLYDAENNWIDQLAFGDQNYPGTPRTQNASCNIPASDYPFTVAQTNWVLATVGDAYGSWMSTGGDVGTPGYVAQFALSDYDMDGDVDMADFDIFVCCMAGPLVSYDPLPTGCALNPDPTGLIAADADGDNDVDMADFRVFQLCFSGEGNPADPTCGYVAEPPGVTRIFLNGNSISVEGSGVVVDETTAMIVAQGVYEITGTLDDGQLVVNASDSVVQLIFKGIDVSNSTNAPFYVVNADSVEIVLADQTENVLHDAETYVYPEPGQDEPNASLFSKDTLTISGTGSLTVYGDYNDAIASKDELIIKGGVIEAIAVDDGIRGKDYLLIQGGEITVTSGGDGLKSDNDEDPELGYIAIENGSLHIISGGDAVAAETDVIISDGGLEITSGGGHTATLPPDLSAKGIKGLASVVIHGGTLDLDCADDGLHSNTAITIDGGTIDIASGDDAIHSDVSLEIDNGTITITDCYEGLESTDITIVNGEINVTSDEDAITAEVTVHIIDGDFTIKSGGGHTATLPPDFSAKGIKGLESVVIEGGVYNIDSADDGIHSNADITIDDGTIMIATGDDGVHSDETLVINGGTINVTISYEGLESSDITINDGTIHVNSTDDGINGAGGDGSGGWPPPPGDHYLNIHGGYIVVYAVGDGIDVNGSITMTGGTVLVHGPTDNFNSAIDYDRTFNISGGYLVAAGSSGMAQAPSTTSTQRSVKITYSSSKTPGTIVRIETTSGGTDVVTFAPSKTYRSFVFSAPSLVAGGSFRLYRGGSSTGALADGLYTGGTYTPGTSTNTITTSSIVTNVSAP